MSSVSFTREDNGWLNKLHYPYFSPFVPFKAKMKATPKNIWARQSAQIGTLFMTGREVGNMSMKHNGLIIGQCLNKDLP